MKPEVWEKLSSRARAVLNYGIAQKGWLEQSRMPRFIAAVPFLAGCDMPLETAFSHLMIYLVALDESAKDIYFHKPHDDEHIYNRLNPVFSFSGGDQKILQCCKDLMALCMVSNYKKDMENDIKRGKYNPLNSGVWDGDALIKELIQRIETNITPEISAFYTPQEALRGYWRD